jgi:hypothetical protein
MRADADAERIRMLARALGAVAPEGTRIYLTGGASAVLEGWRPTTVDVHIRVEPDSDEVLRAIASVKEELGINVELASPLDFLPELPEWRERSRSRFREGNATVLDVDFYSQALSGLERGLELDVADVGEMVARGLVDPRRLLELFAAVEPELYRFPAVDPPSLRAKVERLAAGG